MDVYSICYIYKVKRSFLWLIFVCLLNECLRKNYVILDFMLLVCKLLKDNGFYL